MSDHDIGVYEKYHVKRLHDPTEKHRDCEYYVLDLVHDRHAAPALIAYAASCETEFPLLAKDLREKAANIPNAALRALKDEPEGWVSVPKEPTEEMLAAVRQPWHPTRPDGWDAHNRKRYKAMLAAKPSRG